MDILSNDYLVEMLLLLIDLHCRKFGISANAKSGVPSDLNHESYYQC